jgi:hypothetical protein
MKLVIREQKSNTGASEHTDGKSSVSRCSSAGSLKRTSTTRRQKFQEMMAKKTQVDLSKDYKRSVSSKSPPVK